MGCITSIPIFSRKQRRINGNVYQEQRLLGSGATSDVFLVSNSRGKQFALKVIGCPTPTEMTAAEAEITLMRKCSGLDGVLEIIDHEKLPDRMLVLLPLCAGSWLDVCGNGMSEKEVLKLFQMAIRSVNSLHSGPSASSSYQIPDQTEEANNQFELEDAVEDENDRLMSVPNSPSSHTRISSISDWTPIIHRDVKPANLLFLPSPRNNQTVLMDLGSATVGRKHLITKNDAMEEADHAQVNSSMPFRAPELYAPEVGMIISEKVDIFSLGCSFFALCTGYSPFEPPGYSNIAMSVQNGAWKFPADFNYSNDIQKLISACLELRADDRPDADHLMKSVSRLLLRH